MRRFLVVTWDGAGNLVATLGIARELAARGHDVRVLGHRSIDARCGVYGWRFQPFRHARDFDGTRPFDLSAEMALLSRDFWFSPAVAADVREALNREAAAVILADCMLLGALSAGQAAGVPTAALFHSPFSGSASAPWSRCWRRASRR
jgi:UDP:flavonoid glycosyltransferase YjiC (YdhE family)